MTHGTGRWCGVDRGAPQPTAALESSLLSTLWGWHPAVRRHGEFREFWRSTSAELPILGSRARSTECCGKPLEEALGVAAREATASRSPGQPQDGAQWALVQIATVSPGAVPTPHINAVRLRDRFQQRGLIRVVPLRSRAVERSLLLVEWSLTAWCGGGGSRPPRT